MKAKRHRCLRGSASDVPEPRTLDRLPGAVRDLRMTLEHLAHIAVLLFDCDRDSRTGMIGDGRVRQRVEPPLATAEPILIEITDEHLHRRAVHSRVHDEWVREPFGTPRSSPGLRPEEVV